MDETEDAGRKCFALFFEAKATKHELDAKRMVMSYKRYKDAKIVILEAVVKAVIMSSVKRTMIGLKRINRR